MRSAPSSAWAGDFFAFGAGEGVLVMPTLLAGKARRVQLVCDTGEGLNSSYHFRRGSRLYPMRHVGGRMSGSWISPSKRHARRPRAVKVPVGAVIVRDGAVVASAGNRTLELKDPTAHARCWASGRPPPPSRSERLIGCDLYVSLEPCAMCAGAISFARLRRLYYAAADEGGAVEHNVRFLRFPGLPSRSGRLFGHRRERKPGGSSRTSSPAGASALWAGSIP